MIPPPDKGLGKLEIIEVFDYYDFPRLFACKNRSGQKFLALSVEDTSNTHIFLYSPVSSDRYDLLSQGRLSIREAYSNPEDGQIYKVEISSEGSSVSSMEVNDIPDRWLPDFECVIEADEESTSEQKTSILPASKVAASMKREVANIALKLPKGKTSILSRLLGNFIISFQELVDAVGQSLTGKPTLQGTIPREILDCTQLMVLQTYPSSFGIQFATDKQSDLFDNSLIGDALNSIYNLIIAESDRDKLSNLLHRLRGRTTSKYRALLGILLAVDGNVEFDWGSPKQGYGGKFTLTKETIAKAYEIVSIIEEQIGEEIQVVGKLVGLNVRTRNYEIRSNADKKKYSGKFAADLPSEISHAKINNLYKAVLKKVIKVQSTSGEEKEQWLLVKLLELHDGST